MDISEAHIVGLFVRTFLYGVYITILVHCLRWLLFIDEGWKTRPRVNRPMLVIIVLVFVFTTTNLYIWHQLAISAIRGQVMPDRRLIFASNGLERATTLIIDGILIYRCWVVYSMSWRIAGFPLFLLLSNIGLFVTSFIYRTATGDLDPHLLEAFYSCNIAINLFATGAIIYKILRVTRPGNRSSDLYDVCRILAECGVPYMFTSLFALTATIVAVEIFLFPTSCALSSTMNGIAFNLILIRVGLHRVDTQKLNNGWISSASLSFDVPLEGDEKK